MADPIEHLRSALSDRYRIERELGRGGMATVYLAEDLKHRRQVAIKVLSAELAAVLGPERFLREIEIAGRLQHPHILTLLDSGEGGGLFYYVMPYAEGESLRERLDRERQLPVADALRLASDVAGALDYAHRRGVVHRDIKPENILISGGQAVVADFGIARAIVAAGGARVTPSGTVLGTPQYMSPEQAIGNADVDGRSDVYSLACVLYEMMAGQPPFTGATAESIVHQQLAVEPRPVSALRPAVPEAVTQALSRALAKAPADRFTNAAEFAEALAVPLMLPTRAPRMLVGHRRSLALAALAMVVAVSAFGVWKSWPRISALLRGQGTAQSVKKDWILVAEFDGPPDDPTLAAATRDLVSAALDQSAIVATVTRDQIRNALKLAGKPASAHVDAALAQELAYRSAVRAVVEGRISRLGGGYSIVVRVVDVERDSVVLSVSDVAKDGKALIPTVERVARRIRGGLGERKGAIRASRELVQVMTPSLEAYKTHLKAIELLLTGQSLGSIELCREALSIDPNFVAARQLMGHAFNNMDQVDSALAAHRDALRRPERLSDRVRLLSESSVADLEGNYPAAVADYERLLQRDRRSCRLTPTWAICSIEQAITKKL